MSPHKDSDANLGYPPDWRTIVNSMPWKGPDWQKSSYLVDSSSLLVRDASSLCRTGHTFRIEALLRCKGGGWDCAKWTRKKETPSISITFTGIKLQNLKYVFKHGFKYCHLKLLHSSRADHTEANRNAHTSVKLGLSYTGRSFSPSVAGLCWGWSAQR